MADRGKLALEHAGHDPLLIAATVDHRASAPPALAQALLAACTECARLHTDLQALAAVLPSAATPRRTRDFTLSAADAARLRPRGLTRWLRLIGSSRDTLTRPLAIGFTTLGLAGLLVATVPGAMPGSSSGEIGARSGGVPQIEMQSAASPDGGFQQVAPEPADAAAPVPSAGEGIPPLVVLSSVFLATGGGLFAARRVVSSRARPRGTVR